MFEYKKFPQDFIVEEKLKKKLDWKGHVFFVFFEKKNKTTFDILFYLMKKLNLQRKDFGVAGLKDKYGITRQRISIYKKTLDRRGGEKKFLSILSDVAKILKISWGTDLLKIGENSGNLFFIRLRPKRQNLKNLLNQEFKNNLQKKIETLLNQIKNEGFPNYFGQQRFGKNGNNWKIGKKILFGDYDLTKLGTSKNVDIEIKFKLQSFSSFLFNQYLDSRISKGLFNTQIDGDILNDGILTGPVFGYDLLLPQKGTLAYKLEIDILEKFGLKLNDLDRFKDFNVFGIRRNIKGFVQDLRFKFDKNDLLLMFELKAGIYATEFLDYFLKKLI